MSHGEVEAPDAAGRTARESAAESSHSPPPPQSSLSPAGQVADRAAELSAALVSAGVNRHDVRIINSAAQQLNKLSWYLALISAGEAEG